MRAVLILLVTTALVSAPAAFAQSNSQYQAGDANAVTEVEAAYANDAGATAIAGGNVVTLEILEPGDVFGELEALEGAPRNTAAEALDHAVICVLPWEDLRKYLAKHPNISLKLIQLIDVRLRRTHSASKAWCAGMWRRGWLICCLNSGNTRSQEEFGPH